MKENSKKYVYKLTLSAVFIALATALSLIKIVKMPLGGSVTLLSMLPIVMLSFMLGLRWGMVSAFVYSLIQLALGIMLDGLLAWGLTPVMLVGTITLDLDARNAYRNGELADLTAKEFDVIEFLMRNPNRVYSRESLLDTIWVYEYRSDIRTVDVHIRRLREKLELDPAQPQYIMTKWGVGYYFRK